MVNKIFSLAFVSTMIVGGLVLALPTSFITMSYQPMKCSTPPWQKQPRHMEELKLGQYGSDIETMKDYFASKEIDVRSIHKVSSNKLSCDACEICPKSYSYVAIVNKADKDKLIAEGWKPLP